MPQKDQKGCQSAYFTSMQANLKESSTIESQNFHF